MFRKTCAIIFLLLLPSVFISAFNIDMVIILHRVQVNNTRTVDHALRHDLPKAFPLGEKKTRVALIANINDSTRMGPDHWQDFTDLTDQVKLHKALDNIGNRPIGPATDVSGALSLVRERIFVGPAIRTRLILIVSSSRSVSAREQEESKLLRDAGVFIFSADDHAYVRDDSPYDKHLRLSNSISAESQRSSSYGLFQMLKSEAAKKICTYKQKCFYNVQNGECEQGWYTPSVPRSTGDCSSQGLMPPGSSATPKPCDVEECDKVCDELWPWEKESCDKSGNIIDVQRTGSMPWKQLMLCPRKFTTDSSKPNCSTNVGLLISVVALIVIAAILFIVLMMQCQMAKDAAILATGLMNMHENKHFKINLAASRSDDDRTIAPSVSSHESGYDILVSSNPTEKKSVAVCGVVKKTEKASLVLDAQSKGSSIIDGVSICKSKKRRTPVAIIKKKESMERATSSVISPVMK